MLLLLLFYICNDVFLVVHVEKSNGTFSSTDVRTVRRGHVSLPSLERDNESFSSFSSSSSSFVDEIDQRERVKKKNEEERRV